MINLLPDEIKDDFSYARRNSALRKWILATSFALIGAVIIVAGGWLYMQKSIHDYTNQVANSRQSLKDQKVEETQKSVEEVSTNTKLAIQVLSREILFSKLIRQIGFALPQNTALNSLTIDNVQGGIQLNASAGNFVAASQIQVNLQDPKNGVFEKADINTINCSGEGAAQRKYLCDVSLRALFGKNNSYVYITPTATTSTGGTSQ